MLMIGDPTVVVFDAMDVVFPSPGINPQMEKLRVCVSLFYVCDTGTLLLPCSLNQS
jgi:hypothetical protein